MTLVKFNSRPLVRKENDFFNLSNIVNDLFYNDMGFNTLSTRPLVNIKETENEIKLMLAIPGYEKSDFNISLENKFLTISLEKEEVKEDTNFLLSEFDYNGFKRSFKIGNSINPDKIHATYTQGILEIVLEKKEEEKVKPTRQIEIK